MQHYVERVSKKRLSAAIFAVVVVWFFMTTMFAFNGNTASAANMRLLGYEIYYYTDSTFNFQCGYYNSCTKFRSGCFTPYQERSGIVCGER